MSKPLQVLLVEDNAGDARLLHEMFRKEKAGSFALTHLLRMTEAVAHLEKGGVDILLLDMGLPDGHGLDTVRRAQAAAPNVPVIVLTGLNDEALAAQAMREGAQDYLIKGQIESRALPRALRHAIERHRMQQEAELIRVNQLQFKDKFLSHVSHELRSPLNAIYQFVTILFDNIGGELTPEQHDYLGIVLRNVKQLQAMIDDLLEVTRVQGGQLAIELQCTSVAEVIAFAVSTLQGAAQAKEIALTMDLGGQLPLVCADPMRVRQILIILLDNAIKFTPPGGSVRIRASAHAQDPNTLVLEIMDSGCGIDPAMTERIFDRLFQASDPALAGRQGLGLGLYICKELVARQGGRIWASGTPGKGAVLSFTLPLFSMRNLLVAALGDIANTPTPVTLVVAEMGSQTGWLSDEARGEHSHGMRELLQRCLHADQDVLLPTMGPSGRAELFFIVAATNLAGGESLARRIQRQFDNRDPALRVGLVLSTSIHSLMAAQHGVNPSDRVSFEAVAEAIHAMVNKELSSRMVVNG
ncbi:MAG TPA: ATP-binding protein [Steroidobacteraceae bacterium]|nr:ATP-binding protein [Steroidobacteraceae bacterium]